MPKIMLINVTHSEESRVGIVNNGVLESFEIESLGRDYLKGNIYKGVVHRIHPALEAAFVDIGSDRDAFLPLDEICFRNLPNPPRASADGGDNGRRRRRIRDILRPGEEILVQITKEQFANKPPTLTTFFSLPGRYLVLLPGSEDTGISRRIEGDERVRLRRLVDRLEVPEGFGVIVRTAAGLDEDSGEFGSDLVYLQRLWENVLRSAEGRRGPALVYREQDIVLRTIRDFFTPDIDEIHVDNEEVYERARVFLHGVLPGKEHVLRFYDGDQPIFSAFDVEPQIESVFKRRVQLPSGGSIVIDGTEALTAIDVNSGGSVRGPNPEETAFRTNKEAAAEIARQLRLRDIGGLIVIDFIDMRDHGHAQDIERLMRDALYPDKARHEIGRISRFGLMEISRQRLRPAAMTTSYTACPMCEGHGAIRTTESAALVALRKIHHRVAQGDAAVVTVDLPGPVALYLLNQKRDELARLEQRYNTRLQIDLSSELMPHQVHIEVRARSAADARPAVVAPGAVAPAEVKPVAAGNGAAQPAETAEVSGKKRRRRRGRRKGSGLRAAEAIGEALATIGRRTTPPDAAPAEPPSSEAHAGADPAAPAEVAAPVPGAAQQRRRGRRSRSGGRRRSEAAKQRAAQANAAGSQVDQVRAAAADPPPSEQPAAPSDPVAVPVEMDVAAPAAGSESGRKPARRGSTRGRRRTSPAKTDQTAAAQTPASPATGEGGVAPAEKPPARRTRARTTARKSPAPRPRKTDGESAPSAAPRRRTRSSQTRSAKAPASPD